MRFRLVLKCVFLKTENISVIGSIINWFLIEHASHLVVWKSSPISHRRNLSVEKGQEESKRDSFHLNSTNHVPQLIFPRISRYSLRISFLECLIYTTCKTWLREIREGTVNGFVSVVWGNIPKNRYMSRVYSPTISYNYNFIATGSICHCFHLGMVRYGFHIPTDTNHQQPTTAKWAPARSKWNYNSADRGGKKNSYPVAHCFSSISRTYKL